MDVPVARAFINVTIAAALTVPVARGEDQFTPPPLQPGTAVASAAISGVVLDAATDRPIAGATVTLAERVPGTPVRFYGQVTPPSGRFAFVDLPASEYYFLTTARAGYLEGGYGRPDPRGPSAPVIVGVGQWARDLRVRMSRPGSISGIVTDERGEPVVGVFVRVLPQVLVAGRVQWLAGPVARTDDTGTYRVASLGPGKYVVSVPSVQATLPTTSELKAPGAGAGTSMADLDAARQANRAERLVVDVDGVQQVVVGRHAVPPPPDSDGRPRTYPIVFYPGAPTLSGALAVDLGVGESRSGIDVQLQPVRSVILSGVLQGPADEIGHRLLRLLPLGLEELGQGSETATTVTLPDGRFTFTAVPVGSYVLEARHSMLELTFTSASSLRTAVPTPVSFPARSAASGGIIAASPGVEYAMLSDGKDHGYWGRTRIDVSDSAANEVVLPLRRAATISGRFVVAGGAAVARGVSPVLEPADGSRTLGLHMAVGLVEDSARFAVAGLLAGEYYLRVRGGTVESILWDGTDYADRPFDTSDGHDITGVIVTLADRTPLVRGVVSTLGAAPPAGAAVIAFPAEAERWTRYGFAPPRFKSVLTSMDGRYRLEGLPPGDYYVAAVPASEERAWIDPEYLRARVGTASRLRIERDTTIADLPLRLVP